jgi:MptA/FolE2 family GTP cyclohydrolase
VKGKLARASCTRRASPRRRSSGSSTRCRSHAQPARPRDLYIGCPEDCDNDIDAKTLLAIVEGSMSSEIYELMKRADEGAVVEKAHRRPRFVEDCVREMVRGVVETFDQLLESSYVRARQENLETIHQHNVVAERFGLLGELRREVRTASTPSITSPCGTGSRVAPSFRRRRSGVRSRKD